jgi:hypothetical protein
MTLPRSGGKVREALPLMMCLVGIFALMAIRITLEGWWSEVLSWNGVLGYALGGVGGGALYAQAEGWRRRGSGRSIRMKAFHDLGDGGAVG